MKRMFRFNPVNKIQAPVKHRHPAAFPFASDDHFPVAVVEPGGGRISEGGGVHGEIGDGDWIFAGLDPFAEVGI